MLWSWPLCYCLGHILMFPSVYQRETLRNIFCYRTVTFCPYWTMSSPLEFTTLITSSFECNLCVATHNVFSMCIHRYDISSGSVSWKSQNTFWQKPRLHHDILSACCLCSKQGAGSGSKVTVTLIYCQLLFLFCCWRNVCNRHFLPYKPPTEFSKMWKTNKVSE